MSLSQGWWYSEGRRLRGLRLAWVLMGELGTDGQRMPERHPAGSTAREAPQVIAVSPGERDIGSWEHSQWQSEVRGMGSVSSVRESV